MSQLPDELIECNELQKLDLSKNAFTNMPRVVFKLPKIKTADLSKNYIMGKNVFT